MSDYRARVVSLLREIEWEGDLYGDMPCCPCCGGDQLFGHFEGCELSSMIRESECDSMGDLIWPKIGS